METPEKGRLLVEFSPGALFAVERQVLSSGGGVELLSPPELRKSVRIAGKATNYGAFEAI
jgi:hypothetical protein